MSRAMGKITGLKRLTLSSLTIGLALLVGGMPLALANGFGGSGLPGRREGAGTRGPCLIGGEHAVSLLPVVPESQLGSTLDGYPTFFWHLPQSKASFARFVLYDRYRGQELYRTELSVAGAPGVASFRLPNDGSVKIPKAGLETGKTYYWTVTLVCMNPVDPGDRSGDLRIQGFVQRVASPQGFQDKLRRATERDLPGIYASQGIWHETLTSLIKLRRDHPTDRAIQSDWASLMQGIKLEQLANAPVVSCCQVSPSRTSLLN